MDKQSSVALGWLVAALCAGQGCQRVPMTACDRLAGIWRGVRVEATPGSDPDAVRVMSEVVRAERWRITRISPSSMQRERANENYGRAPGDPLYVQSATGSVCNVELRTQDTHRRMTYTLLADGMLQVRGENNWMIQVFQRY